VAGRVTGWRHGRFSARCRGAAPGASRSGGTR
jgi:hypothetical protein